MRFTAAMLLKLVQEYLKIISPSNPQILSENHRRVVEPRSLQKHAMIVQSYNSNRPQRGKKFSIERIYE